MSAVEVLRWNAPGPYEVAFATRKGGVSEGPFASLNLGKKYDDPERVDENRRRLCAELSVDAGRLALGFQIHSGRVNRAAPGRRPGQGGEPGDGLWTEEVALPVLALTADCLPIALVRRDGDAPAVAVLHAGRIGILAGIIEAGVASLAPAGIAAAIGPAIGPCCYEVGEEVAGPYRDRFGSDVFSSGKLDLWMVAERALLRAGCASVERLDLCTACHPELFFSYRRDGTPGGGQGVVAIVA
jgi:polyphenol oxidase